MDTISLGFSRNLYHWHTREGNLVNGKTYMQFQIYNMVENSKGLLLKPYALDSWYWCMPQIFKAILCRQAQQMYGNHQISTRTTFVDCIPNKVSKHYI